MIDRNGTHQQAFSGRLAIQQRVLPTYRAPLFELLAKVCEGGMSVFAGDPLPGESIPSTGQSSVFERYPARNRHIKDPSSAAYFCWQGGLIEWLKQVDPTALIVEANPRYLSTSRAIDWMHKRGRPVIGWGLGAPLIETSSFVIRPLAAMQSRFRRRFLLSCDAIVAYSRRGAGEYIAESFPQARVFVATNAVLSRPTEPPPERPAEFRGPPKVLFVGRLQSRKRIDKLINACANLPADCQPHIWIIGDGPAGDELEKFAKDVYPQAEFLGAKYGADLRSYFIDADLFVLPGTGGLAVQEAMAYALPVIVARGDGTQEDLVRPENGWLIPPDDPGAMRQSLKAALTDIKRLRSMGLESYRIVREEINLETMVETFIYALNTVKAPRLRKS